MSAPLRIFLIASAVPDPRQHATHMVLYETLSGITHRGHRVTLQVMVPEGAVLSSDALAQLAGLSGMIGVRVLPPLGVDGVRQGTRGGGGGRLLATARRVLDTRVEDLYPHVRLRAEVERRITATRSEIVVNVWSTEGLAATHQITRVPKYAYYAMPEHLAPEARLRHPGLFDIPIDSLLDRGRLFLSRLFNRRREGFHFQMMRAYDAVSNICAFHADLYTRMGHPRSVYLQNMWPDRFGERWRALRKAAEGRDGEKVIGSLGNVFATGNTFGLYYLGAEVLPELTRRLRERETEIHIFGRGHLYSRVAAVLSDPRVRMRGWVADIDAEILSSKVFLVMNNAGYYRGAHTRFLHAWSLGACVVAHCANSDGMPEIRHGENALLGASPREIADLITLALKDDTLRRQIGEGGRRTFEQCFRSDVVVPKLLSEVRLCLNEWVTARTPTAEAGRETFDERVQLGGHRDGYGH